MTFVDWISEPVNWVYAPIGLIVLYSAFRVVTVKNLVHAALFLVASLAGTAGLFLLLSAEFVAWVLVLVYIGAVIVLFLFGIMITRAPTGRDENLDSQKKIWPAILSIGVFVAMAGASISAFESQLISGRRRTDLYRGDRRGPARTFRDPLRSGFLRAVGGSDRWHNDCPPRPQPGRGRREARGMRARSLRSLAALRCPVSGGYRIPDTGYRALEELQCF